MAVITAQNIADKAKLILQDQTSIRWTEAELLGWINSAQREIMIYKPNSNPVVANMTPSAGTKQTIPSSGLQLLDVTRNATGGAVTNIDRKILDVTIPDWHTQTAGAAKHYVYDERFPTVFYLYPKQVGTESVEIVYSALPSDLTVMGSTIFNDIYETPILDYVLYRAYSKDNEFTANAQQSIAHYQAFIAALTGKTQAEVGLAPEQRFGTPKVAARA